MSRTRASRGLGNRLWRVRLPDGRTAIMKLHRGRRSPVASVVRALLTAAVGMQTSPTAAGRLATERRLLQRWREDGVDVPALLAPQEYGFAPGPWLLMEDLPGPTLLRLCWQRPLIPEAERAALLERFGAAWGRRHRLALERRDVSLLMEHASFDHVLVSGDRLVHFDLEQAFLPGPVPEALLAKEVLGCLRSLAKSVPEERFQADLAALLRGYGDPGPLHAVVREARHSPNLIRRFVWWFDGRKQRVRRQRHPKCKLVEALARALEQAQPSAPAPLRVA